MDHLPPTTCGFSELQNGLSTEEESWGGEGGEGEALCNGVEGLSEMEVEVELAPRGEVLACLGGRGLFAGGKKVSVRINRWGQDCRSTRSVSSSF